MGLFYYFQWFFCIRYKYIKQATQMAKLNWEKLNRESRTQWQNDYYYSQQPKGGYTKAFFKDSNLWSLQGKYFGTHIHKLPLDYLGWILDNKTGKSFTQIRKQAEDELYRRYRLTQEVGGPDRNTAVKKLG